MLAAGPYAAIYGVWQTSTVAQQTDVPIWILAVVSGEGTERAPLCCAAFLQGLPLAAVPARQLARRLLRPSQRACLRCCFVGSQGGAGIVLGLATFGYKIMRVLGVKMTRLTNSRGVRPGPACAWGPAAPRLPSAC